MSATGLYDTICVKPQTIYLGNSFDECVIQKLFSSCIHCHFFGDWLVSCFCIKITQPIKWILGMVISALLIKHFCYKRYNWLLQPSIGIKSTAILYSLLFVIQQTVRSIEYYYQWTCVCYTYFNDNLDLAKCYEIYSEKIWFLFAGIQIATKIAYFTHLLFRIYHDSKHNYIMRVSNKLLYIVIIILISSSAFLGSYKIYIEYRTNTHADLYQFWQYRLSIVEMCEPIVDIMNSILILAIYLSNFYKYYKSVHRNYENMNHREHEILLLMTQFLIVFGWAILWKLLDDIYTIITELMEQHTSQMVYGHIMEPCWLLFEFMVQCSNILSIYLSFEFSHQRYRCLCKLCHSFAYRTGKHKIRINKNNQIANNNDIYVQIKEDGNNIKYIKISNNYQPCPVCSSCKRSSISSKCIICGYDFECSVSSDIVDNHYKNNQNNESEITQITETMYRPRLQRLLDDALMEDKNVNQRRIISQLYNADKYGTIPEEYTFTKPINYYKPSALPIHSSLREELKMLINDKAFNKVLQNCQRLLSTKIAKYELMNTNDDLYGIRFGDKISIEHMVALYFYCNFSHICYCFRGSFRNKNYCSNCNQQSWPKLQECIQCKNNTKSYHYKHYYHFGRFLYETDQFIGKRLNKHVYLGLNKRFLFRTLQPCFGHPTSTSIEFHIAASFATNTVKQQHGIILELAPLFTASATRLETRYYYCSWISNYGNEEECILFGFDNTILIKNIFIWTYCTNNKSKGYKWKSLQFGINALHFWQKISTGYSGIDSYNVQISSSKKKDNTYFYKKIERFLVQLIRYELDEINYFPTTDSLQYLHQLFHHMLFCKTGSKSDQIYSIRNKEEILLDVDFRNINKEQILHKMTLLRKQIFMEDNKTISKHVIMRLYPNIDRFIDQNGNCIQTM